MSLFAHLDPDIFAHSSQKTYSSHIRFFRRIHWRAIQVLSNILNLLSFRVTLGPLQFWLMSFLLAERFLLCYVLSIFNNAPWVAFQLEDLLGCLHEQIMQPFMYTHVYSILMVTGHTRTNLAILKQQGAMQSQHLLPPTSISWALWIMVHHSIKLASVPCYKAWKLGKIWKGSWGD